MKFARCSSSAAFPVRSRPGRAFPPNRATRTPPTAVSSMMASAGTALRNQRAKCQDGSANSSTTHRSLFVAEHQADVVILGGGSGGYAAALRAALLNKSVLLVDRDKVGRTCLHRGCIPTKALLHAGEVAVLGLVMMPCGL